jgi:lactate permease
MLGWLGVFLTGSDSGSNALFGSLQKLTALELHSQGYMVGLDSGQAQVLICTSNSTGGVMGKMIDAQSIVVATAATNQVGQEARIFRIVATYSLVMAALMGALVMAQAYIPALSFLVPSLPASGG